ncbi:hypothetical protein PMZ80_000905 [Knufia obscura]|uniref:BTB domain-containing protein n=2 Tax=Knufia TaxID=430999 RepID=A0AAN8I5D9_9EURO|nr:hypothetical protein PMZ80_000905 [Knufia obscura]KAK5950301.1 hypothetical protein OHC33_008770 [Knufia fluminis]
MDEEHHTEDELSDSLHDLLRGITSPAAVESASGRSLSTGRLRGEIGASSNSRSSLPLLSTATPTRSTPRQDVLLRGRSIPSLQEHLAGSADSPVTANAISPPPPNRSIFASGPPTSSVSANTAHASMSTTSASGSSLPLSALTASNLSRRTISRPSDLNIVAASAGIPGTEKDVDEIGMGSGPEGADLDGGNASTSQRLSNLFASDTPGLLSREPTQLRNYPIPRSPPHDASTLAGHLLYNGFLSGRHSDITVHAFGRSYKLHKLLLDRAPYFSTAFWGPWKESSASEMTIVTEDIDPNITQAAFELALKRLYGTVTASQEEQEAIGLFATACWLDMPDLIENCVDYILRQMNTAKIHHLVKLVTNSYYGRPGDRILASAKSMLCREGWEMPYEHWDHIPAEIIREVIGGDPFYVPGEWERWFLSLKILNRRLRRLAIESKLVDADGTYLYPKPQSLRFFAVRFDATYRRDAGFGAQKHWIDKDDMWCALYTSPEVSPLLVLLDEGIHYLHLRFEQLQHIRSARDILGVPILPEKVISDALWMQMELRQRVVNAREGDIELGLSEFAEELDEPEETVEAPSETARGKQRAESSQTPTEASTLDMESGSWDGNGRPRKFWIPSSDVSCIFGGVRESITSPAATTSGDWTSANRLSANLEPSDVAWAVDFAGSVFENTSAASNLVSSSSPPRFSHYPPFRFSAEFPNPRTLKEKKRVYSQTVWYAGSMWNLYIQRINTSKGQQLGIYLHRAKDRDPSDDPLAQFVPASVDDRIGQLEREMLMRKANTRPQTPTAWHGSTNNDSDEPTSTQEFDANTSTLLSPSRSGSYRDPERTPKTSQNTSRPALPRPAYSQMQRAQTPEPNKLSMDPDSPEIDASLLRANRRLVSSISTMPPYIDARSTIKTYFKIYSPSKAGRLLSVYESAPDSFNFGKSWGWRSSQLVLDDGVGFEAASSGKPPTVNLTGKEGKLRYMVVIGNV